MSLKVFFADFVLIKKSHIAAYYCHYCLGTEQGEWRKDGAQ